MSVISNRSISERLTRIGFEALHVGDVTTMIGRAIATPLASSAFPSSDSLPAIVVTGLNTSPGAHCAEERWIRKARFAGLQPHQVLQAGPVQVDQDQQGSDDARVELGRAASYDQGVGVVLRAMSGAMKKSSAW